MSSNSHDAHGSDAGHGSASHAAPAPSGPPPTVITPPEDGRPSDPTGIVGFVVAIGIGAALNALPWGVAAGAVWLAVMSGRPSKKRA